MVHEYLHRHLYLEYLLRYKATIFQALMITFVFSVLFHELFFMAAFGRLSLYLSSLQLCQLLLTFLFSKLKGTMLGNMIFWYGQVHGVTMVMYLYYMDWFNYKYSKGGVFDM